MKEKEAKICLYGLLALAVLVILLITVSIKAQAERKYFDDSTSTAEAAYRSELKDVLGEFGARNAGITMTKQSTDGTNFQYCVNVHLPEYIGETEKEIIARNLETVSIDVEKACVKFSFS